MHGKKAGHYLYSFDTCIALNKDLSSLQEWFHANKLTVNLTKTKYIHFGSKQRIKNVMIDESDLALTLGNLLKKQHIHIFRSHSR